MNVLIGNSFFKNNVQYNDIQTLCPLHINIYIYIFNGNKGKRFRAYILVFQKNP